MLIVRAPMRISLAGGGTDLAAYYMDRGGRVLSAAINKHFYAMVEVGGQTDVQITSSDYGTFYQHRSDEPLFCEGDLSLPKAVLQHFGIARGARVFLASEVPPGTGLGSSSAVAVALVKALATLLRQPLTPAQVAAIACYIEIEKLGMPIGLQDQYASAFGGINTFEFSASGVAVRPLTLSPETVTELESRLLLFFTQSSRNSSTILRSQRDDTARRASQVMDALDGLKELAAESAKLLQAGRVDEFGRLLDTSWILKKRLSAGVTNADVDRYYAAARANGAVGGKLTGAGGGGFLMVLSEQGAQRRLTQALEELGLYRMDFRFEASGAQVLMNSGLEISDDMMAISSAA
jgi:D-glycero-alpha-D-manno-heptose-7-phosphate kinase